MKTKKDQHDEIQETKKRKLSKTNNDEVEFRNDEDIGNPSSKTKRSDVGVVGGGGNDSKTSTLMYDLPALDAAYRNALKAYKADKSNKDLRRAKTAAKRAWDEALVKTAEAGAKPIVCRNCSQLFMFTMEEEFKERGWDVPVQCKKCTRDIDIHRSKDVNRNKLDMKQNMCYEFQKTGQCSRGDRCKFSHAKHHIGKNKQAGKLLIKICKYFEKGDTCPHGTECRFRHS